MKYETVNLTQRAIEVREYFDQILEDNIEKIVELTNIDRSQLLKINPADFLNKNKYIRIDNYIYQSPEQFIKENKKDNTFLISPFDDPIKTSSQIMYKSYEGVQRKLRASKCDALPLSKEVAVDFMKRNHRQSVPNVTKKAVIFGLIYKNEIVAVMIYDTYNNDGLRGKKEGYELLRLAIARGTQIYGGAGKLQKICEEALREIGVSRIFSYSNATINSGSVYEQLGFTDKGLGNGSIFVIMEDNSIRRLVQLKGEMKNYQLAAKGRLTFLLGGNKLWIKNI